MYIAIFVAVLAAAPVNLYVAPTGSDSNSCLNAARPCATVNTAIDKAHKLAGPYVNAPVTIYVASGSYYTPPYAPDGGSPDPADAMGLIDIEGFNFGPGGSLAIDCAIQSISNGLTASVVDGGAVSGYSTQAWVQFIPPDGGWGNYAVDAGYSYTDGGLIATALQGKFLQVTSGSHAGLIYPIKSNDYATITFVTPSSSSYKLDATAQFSLYAPASHFYPYPVDGGASTSYSEADLFVAGNSARSTVNQVQNAQYYPAQISVVYCDFADSHSVTVESRDSSLLQLAYGSIEATASAYGEDIVTYGAPVAVQGEVLSGAYTSIVVNNGAFLWLNGSYVTKPAGQYNFVTGTHSPHIQLRGNTFSTPSMSTTSPAFSGAYGADLSLLFNDIDTGGAAAAVIAPSFNSQVYTFFNTFDGDGGAGIFQLNDSSSAFVSLNNYNASVNLVSLDNGISWIATSTFSTTDGGAAGYNAICNVQWGNCISNK